MARTIRRESTDPKRTTYPSKRARQAEKRTDRQKARRELAGYR